MVKLLKHELIALFRVLAFFAVAVVVFAVVGRILLATAPADGSGANGFLALIFVTFYVFAILALVLAAWALGISRFYKTLFTGEGYMTLSLPVSPMGIIWAKLLSSLIAMFAACLVSALSLLVFFIGVDPNLFSEIGMDVAVSFGYWFDTIVAAPLQFFEELVLFFVGLPVSLLAIYACISVGQLFTSHRKIAAFVIVVVLYIAYQMLSVYVLSPILVAAEDVSVHLVLWIEIVLVAAADAVCFLLVRYILKNKVNLLV